MPAPPVLPDGPIVITSVEGQQRLQVRVSVVTRGLSRPWAVAFLPDGDFLVTENQGRLRTVTPDGKVSEPIAGVPPVKVVAAQSFHDIVLDPDFAPTWAKQNAIEDASPEALAADERLIAAVQAGVDEANAKMARVEQIKKFKVLPTEWMPGGDELTPTMKLKRKPISEKYKAEIEELYAKSPGGEVIDLG